MKYVLLAATLLLAGCATQQEPFPSSVTSQRQQGYRSLDYMQQQDPVYNRAMRDAGGS